MQAHCHSSVEIDVAGKVVCIFTKAFKQSEVHEYE
jgi:hypothetical protein